MIRAAFDQGQVPVISVVNKATLSLGVDLAKMVKALQTQVARDLGPVWGVMCQLKIAKAIAPGTWGLVFLDDADVANALGYHDLTADGFPISKVFVRTTQSAKEQVSVTASHEICEMLVDPAINLWGSDPKGLFWALETSDAVEATTYGINGVAMSNFQFPSWWEGFRKAGSTKFDFLGKCKKPFQLLTGGYSLISQGGQVQQRFGSLAKAKRFAREDRRQHRSQYRLLANDSMEVKLTRSEPCTATPGGVPKVKMIGEAIC